MACSFPSPLYELLVQILGSFGVFVLALVCLVSIYCAYQKSAQLDELSDRTDRATQNFERQMLWQADDSTDAATDKDYGNCLCGCQWCHCCGVCDDVQSAPEEEQGLASQDLGEAQVGASNVPEVACSTTVLR